MKKLLIIQESLRGGGAERVLINILNNIDYSKYSIDLVLLVEDGVYLDKVPKNVKIKRIYPKLNYNNNLICKIFSLVRRYYIKYFPKFLYRFLIGNEYDYEIAFLEGVSTKILSKSSNKKSKKIGWIHIDLNKYNVMSNYQEKKCYKKIDEIICVSNDAKNSFLNLYPEFKEKTKVIYNFINVEEIKQLSNKKIEYDFNTPTIIGVGRLVEQKRFDLLIRAHKKLIDEGVKNKLLILGEGGKEKELKYLVEELKIQNSVDILPFKENPYPYIKSADVFVVSSDFEGFSLVIAEALVLGKAIVSTSCVGPRELLDDGNFGQLVECNDINNLSESIKKLLLEEKVRKKFENKSLQRSKIFNANKVMNEIYDLFN